MIKSSQKIFVLLFLLFSIFYFLDSKAVFAAEISFDSEKRAFGRNEEFLLQVFLNVKEGNVNAIDGRVVFPLNLLEVKEIRDGNSAVNFWIEKPNWQQETSDKRQGKIAFSGLTPGGFSRQKEFLFSVVFRAKQDGTGTIQADGLKMLRNDGVGSEIRTTVSPFSFSISKEQNPLSSKIRPVDDTDPPEDFLPSVVSDQGLFDGKYFVVFATQDKKSGIDRYEIQETRYKRPATKEWIVAGSPYVLKDQKLRSYIYVKAVDKAGNERLVVLPPSRRAPWYEDYSILVIMITIIIVGLYFRKKWQRVL